jgi:peptidyl-prolyl cis-trans isomerase C
MSPTFSRTVPSEFFDEESTVKLFSGRATALVLVGTAIAAVATAQEPAPSAQAPPQTAPAPADPQSVMLTVNGEPIYLWQVNLMVPQVAATMQQQGIQANQQQMMQAAMQQSVQAMLLAQEATRLGLKPNGERVTETMQSIESQSGGPEGLAANLARVGVTREQLLATIEEADLVQELVETQIAPGIEVTDAEIEAYYADNPDAFTTPEQVRARHILFTVEQDAPEDEVAAARVKADAARERAIAGEDFASLATELSEGPSAPRGGDLGLFDRSRMVEPFASAAFDLEPGEISPVVRTRFGFHVIKCEENVPASTASLDEVRDQLRQFLSNQQLGAQVDALVVQLGEKADIQQPGVPQTAPAE